MTTTLRVAQFVYSNVEAEHSPTGRRGFQVWRWSRRLAPHQREIARRLEDFDWPAADAAKDVLTVRRTFFPIGTGDVVIARTVPVRERDAMNRAGRFHAHAVVVPLAEFEKVGNNPFALLDRFAFRDGPTESVEGDLGSGEVADEIAVAVGPPRAEPDDGVGPLFPLLLRWLAADDPKPAALPFHPERVAGFLRELFRRLPADLRLKATFDTLSSGQSLGTLPFRFAGAFDPPTLRDWVYRKVYRIEEQGGAYTTTIEPPADPALDALAKAWESGADDAARSHSYRLLRALADPDRPLPPDPPARAVELVAAVPAAQEQFRARIAARLEKDLDVPELRELVRTDAEQFVGKLSPDGLRALVTPIPATRIAGWLLTAVTNRRLSGATAERFKEWINTARARSSNAAVRNLYDRLSLITLLWEPGGWQQLEATEKRSAWTNAISWLRERPSVVGPLHPALTNAITAQEWADRLVVGFPEVSGVEADQIGWGLVLADPAHEPEFAAELRFALACRLNEKGIGEYLQDSSRRPSSRWLASIISSLLQNVIIRARIEHTNSGVPQVGISISCPEASSVWHAILQVLPREKLLRPVFLRKGIGLLIGSLRGQEIKGNDDISEVESLLNIKGFGRLVNKLSDLSSDAFGRFLTEKAFKQFVYKMFVIGEPRIEDGALCLLGEPVSEVADETKDLLWAKIVSAAEKKPYLIDIRLAGLLQAIVTTIPVVAR